MAEKLLPPSLPFLLTVVMVLYFGESNQEPPTPARSSDTDVMGHRVKPGI